VTEDLTLKILVFSQYFWPESFLINDLAKGLVDNDHQVEVLTGKPNYPHGIKFKGYEGFGYQLESNEDILIHRIPILARGVGRLRLALNYMSFIISGLLFSPFLLRRRKFDVIFVYGLSPILQVIPAIFLGRLKRIPVVVSVQDLWPDSLLASGYIRNKPVLKLIEYVVKVIYSNVDLLLVQSKAFLEPVKSKAGGTPVKYYPNSVGHSFAVPTPDFSGYMAGLNDGFSVMFAGNVGSAQATEIIIEAATLLRAYTDIHFLVVGDGSRRDWLIQERSIRGLSNFHLPGRFPVDTMPSLMGKASVLLVTLTDYKVFAATVPSKIQAYMAAGRPILACLNGEGARLVIEAGAGIAAPAGDAKALAAGVLKLYKMPATERARLGANGASYFKENFDHDKLVLDLVEHLQMVLNVKEEMS
jgi:glycosyltransferase involved in cell wall biosynthesis